MAQDINVLTHKLCLVMKWMTLLITIFLSGLYGNTFSQDWIRTYTSVTGKGYNARYVIESYDKGYVILGTAYNYKYGLILKTDINGNLLWEKLIGDGSYTNMPIYIEETQDSGFIISGTTSIFSYRDAFALKLNACLEKEWCKVLYSSNNYENSGQRIRQLADGNFMLLTRYYGGIEHGQRIHLHKLDQDGELIWQSSYAENDTLMFSEEAYDLDIVNDSIYLITGYCFYPDPGQPGGWIRPYFICVDSSGAMMWETIWGVNDYFHGKTYNSATDLNSNLYSIGLHIGNDGQYPAMVKTGPEGQELLSSDLVDSAYFGQGQTITFMEDSNLFIALGWKDPDQTWHNGFMKADTNGIPLGFHEVIPLSNALISTAKTFDNKFITVGTHKDNSLDRWIIYAFKLNSDLGYDTVYTTPFVYDSLCPYGITSDTTDLDCDILVLVDEEFVPVKEVKLKIFPNPALDHITVSYPDVTHTGHREIVIFNSMGMEVKCERLKNGDEETQMNVSELPAGIYFVVMTEKGKRIGEGKLILVS